MGVLKLLDDKWKAKLPSMSPECIDDVMICHNLLFFSFAIISITNNLFEKETCDDILRQNFLGWLFFTYGNCGQS